MSTLTSNIQIVAKQAAESALCHHAHREGITYTDAEYEAKLEAMTKIIADELDTSSTLTRQITNGVHLIPTAEVYAVESDSTYRMHQVTFDPMTGGARCDGPHCRGITCKHIRKLLRNRPSTKEISE